MPAKLFGALLLTISGGYGACLLNRYARGRIARLDALIALLRLFKTQIDCFSLPVKEIFARCEISLLRRCGWKEEEAPESFDFFCRAVDRTYLTEEGRRILDGFTEQIGNGYREDQVRACDDSIGLFCAERDRLLAELPRVLERNVTLCLSAAVGLAVMLL